MCLASINSWAAGARWGNPARAAGPVPTSPHHSRSPTPSNPSRDPTITPLAPSSGPSAPRAARLYVASTSPRRRELLSARGVAFEAIDPGIDDGTLERGPVPPEHWVQALALIKARSGVARLAERGLTAVGADGTGVFVLGADTVVVHGGDVLGKPRDAEHAREMICRLMNDAHDVLTGVALVRVGEDTVRLATARAVSHFGRVSSEQVDSYVASGAWRGKAGAYNLDERLRAGWPVRVEGDRTCVTGLPMQTIEAWVLPFAAEATRKASSASSAGNTPRQGRASAEGVS